MAKHKLLSGSRLIEGLYALGTALGYTVRTELPVENRPNAPAVDVAWFADDEQVYPLMIFEVESVATNAMANNPTKVFGQAQENFERPLFFFHLVVKSGQQTSRIDTLRRVFGQHNYRVYELDSDSALPLLKDVLSQHRRIRRTFCLGDFLSTVAAYELLDLAPATLAKFARDVGLRAHYLADLAHLATADERYVPAYLDVVEMEVDSCGVAVDRGYASFFGRTYARPIHLGLLVHAVRLDAADGLERLRWWQERSSYMTQIGPHFGLSRDYDLFMLGSAAALWAVVAMLMSSLPAALDYIAQQMTNPLTRLGESPRETSFHTALWSLHVAAFCESDEIFKLAQAFVNARGGVPEVQLYTPPAFVNVDYDSDWLGPADSDLVKVPSRDEFLSELSGRADQDDCCSPERLACELLAFDDGTHEGAMARLSKNLVAFWRKRSRGTPA